MQSSNLGKLNRFRVRLLSWCEIAKALIDGAFPDGRVVAYSDRTLLKDSRLLDHLPKT